MSYCKEYVAACQRARKLGLGDFSLKEESMPLDPAVLNAIEATGHVPFERRLENGFNVNFGMYHMLSTRFHIPGATLTFGNVSVAGLMRYSVAANDFKKIVAEQSGEDHLGHYHLWTTLPGGYVLDHVLLSGLSKEGVLSVDEAIPAQRYLYGHADQLPYSVTYHPMLVGLEFLVASGTIDQEALEYLMGKRFPKQYS